MLHSELIHLLNAESNLTRYRILEQLNRVYMRINHYYALQKCLLISWKLEFVDSRFQASLANPCIE